MEEKNVIITSKNFFKSKQKFTLLDETHTWHCYQSQEPMFRHFIGLEGKLLLPWT